MPTTLYTKQNGGSVSYEGKSYEIENGAVEVPDAAVAELVESHGFSYEPQEVEKPAKAKAASKKDDDSDDEGESDFDITALTKAQLIALNDDLELGAELKSAMPKDEVFALVAPLWEAAKAKAAAAEEEKAAE